MLSGHAIEPLDRRTQERGVGRERNGLGLHRGADGDASQVVGPQRRSVSWSSPVATQMPEPAIVLKIASPLATDQHATALRVNQPEAKSADDITPPQLPEGGRSTLIIALIVVARIIRIGPVARKLGLVHRAERMRARQ